jgi:hypothetical protein
MNTITAAAAAVDRKEKSSVAVLAAAAAAARICASDLYVMTCVFGFVTSLRAGSESSDN